MNLEILLWRSYCCWTSLVWSALHSPRADGYGSTCIRRVGVVLRRKMTCDDELL